VRLSALAGVAVAAYWLAVALEYDPWGTFHPWFRGEGGAPYVAFVFTLCKALTGLALVWQFQRSRDKSTGVHWVEVKAELDTGNLAWALHRGLYFLASCLLVGMMMS
jgi:hypothetical protein